MATVNDAGGVARETERERQKVEQAEIDDRDRKAIQNFVQHRRVHGGETGTYAETTEQGDLRCLRLSAERADVALVDMGIDDINQLIETLKEDYGVTTGIDAYTRVYRPFFRWLDDHAEYGSYEWWDHVKTGNVDYPTPSERDFPTQADIDAILQAARTEGGPRDAALVSFYADTGVRRSLGAQLRVGDVELDSEPATFTPNPDGQAQKGVEVKPYPMFDCVAELRTYLNNYHPDPENPDAPLWVSRGYDPDDPDAGALSTRQINRLFNTYADAAGVDDKEHTPHSYRHAAVGRWKERGYTLTQVQRRTAWKDQAAAEMWGKYGDPDDSAIDSAIAEHEGQPMPEAEDGDDAGAKPPERRTCPSCKLEGITSDHCPQCGSAVSADAQNRKISKLDALRVLLEDADTPEKRAMIANIMGLPDEELED